MAGLKKHLLHQMVRLQPNACQSHRILGRYFKEICSNMPTNLERDKPNILLEGVRRWCLSSRKKHSARDGSDMYTFVSSPWRPLEFPRETVCPQFSPLTLCACAVRESAHLGVQAIPGHGVCSSSSLEASVLWHYSSPRHCRWAYYLNLAICVRGNPFAHQIEELKACSSHVSHAYLPCLWVLKYSTFLLNSGRVTLISSYSTHKNLAVSKIMEVMRTAYAI